jgi:hypothetical protein
VYINYLKEIIIHHILPCAINISLEYFQQVWKKKETTTKGGHSNEKRKNIKDNNTYLDNKVFTTINSVVVSTLYLFHYEIARLKLFIANLISPYQHI